MLASGRLRRTSLLQVGIPRCGCSSPVHGRSALRLGQVRARLRSDLVAAHAEMFLISGDLNSALYTSSRAMHSAVLGLLQARRCC